MTLLMIESEAERKFFEKERKARNLGYVWMAVKRTQPGGDIWQWSNIEMGNIEVEWKRPVGSNKNECINGHFSDWRSNEPNNNGGREECVVTGWRGKGWNDAPCKWLDVATVCKI